MKKAVITTALLAVAGLAAQGCTESQGAGTEPEIGSNKQELIGGVPGNSPTLNAIGTMGFLSTYTDCDGSVYTYYEPFCTATLIGSSTVLTAKHRQELLAYADEFFEPVFAVGPDGLNPERTVKIVDSRKNPVNYGGFVGYGRDVALVYLDNPITDITPIKYATPTASLVGEDVMAVGYGIQDNNGTYGTRQMGSLHVNALEGKIFELMFGSYENFKDWYLQGNAPSDDECEDCGSDPGFEDDEWIDEWLRDIYENTFLLPGYEVYVGNGEGDAQPCYGDSGGPLLGLNDAGEIVTYGVTSGGLGTNDLICDRGAVYAAFGTQTTNWINQNKNWSDPCGDKTTLGSCEGNKVVRCSALDEGKRRVLKTNCALIGQTCAVASNSQATCVPAGEEPIVLNPPVDFCDFPEDGGAGDGDGDGDGDDGEMSIREKMALIKARAQSDYIGPLGDKP